MNFKEYLWPLARLGEGMEVLTQRAGLRPVSGKVLVAPETLARAGSTDLPRWVAWAGPKLGIEAEVVENTVAEFAAFAASAGPAMIHFEADEGPFLVLLLKSARGKLHLLAPDLQIHRCPVEVLRHAMCWRYEAPLQFEMDRLLELADLPKHQWPRVRTAILHERLGSKPLAACWMLRHAPSSGFWRQLAHARLPHRLTGMLGGWLNATFALDAERILKRRLLADALKLDIETVRHQGAGQMLSRVMESQPLEALAVSGGLSVLASLVELALAAWVLAIGVGGGLHVLILLD